MMHVVLPMALAVASLCAAPCEAARTLSAAPVPRLWAMGDSSLDVGNLGLIWAADSNPNTIIPTAYKPYTRPDLPGLTLQRLSNDRVLSEYVADHYGTTLYPSAALAAVSLPASASINFAVYGAVSYTRGTPLDLPYQVLQLKQRKAALSLDLSADRILLSFSGDDIYTALAAAIEPLSQGSTTADLAAGKAICDNAIKSLKTFVMAKDLQTVDGNKVPSLINMGLSKFIFLNAPDISKFPAVGNLAAALGGNPAVKSSALSLVKYYNNKLNVLVASLKTELTTRVAAGTIASYELTRVDTYTAFNNIYKNANSLGLVDKTHECYLTSLQNTLLTGAALAPNKYRSPCTAAKASKWLFFDDVHPSGGGQKLLGEAIVSAL